MRRDSFILYTKINAVVRELEDEQKGRLFQAILDYEETGEVPELDHILKLVFIPIKQDLDKNNEKWEGISKARSEAGKKGMASRHRKDAAEQPEAEADSASVTKPNKTNKAQQTITKPNKAQQSLTNVTEYEYEYDNDNDPVRTPPHNPPASGGTGEAPDGEDGSQGESLTVETARGTAGETKPTANHSTTLDRRFIEFWRLYPKRVGKGAAERAFAKIAPDKALFEIIMRSVQDNLDRNMVWRKNNGEFIPNPSTWLNQRRWEDDVQTGAPQGTNSTYQPTTDRIQRNAEWLDQFLAEQESREH